MNAEIKEQWLKALRGGEYQQAQSFLKTYRPSKGTIGYCCLGVLCDLHRQAMSAKASADEPTPDWSEDLEYLGEQAALPPEVAEWAGLDSEDPGVRITWPNGEKDFKPLSYVNDAGTTFAEIADLIEQEL